jgi:hypothetical protein
LGGFPLKDREGLPDWLKLLGKVRLEHSVPSGLAGWRSYYSVWIRTWNFVIQSQPFEICVSVSKEQKNEVDKVEGLMMGLVAECGKEMREKGFSSKLLLIDTPGSVLSPFCTRLANGIKDSRHHMSLTLTPP